jgi:pimeloyl-ACP methyl ester carboxylesterase
LRRVKTSLQLFVGEQEMEAFKRSAEMIRRAVPGARRVYLEHTGHLGLLEDPVTCAQRIREALVADCGPV